MIARLFAALGLAAFAPALWADALTGDVQRQPINVSAIVMFVAFVGAYRDPGSLDPWVAAVLASLLVTWVTFVPCFLFVLLGAPYVERLRDAAARHREAELWVAELDGDVVGTVTIALEGSPWREIGEPGEGEFRMLAVAPAARRRGVGEALMQLVLDRFGGLGAHAVVLSSLAEMAAAHRVYERAGFRRLPERDWSPIPGVDLLAFRLEL